MGVFENRFSPAEWRGARAQQFTKAEDGFQQLVGDALHALFLGHAHVAPTEGRDGANDAWVDVHLQADDQFAGFEFPLIVECKHHDEQAKAPDNNIKQGWERVKEKLQKQAANGWPGDYAPWKQARSYLYCISARFPNQQARNAFQQQVRDFFAALPACQHPPINPEQIRVWDWSDLGAWFRNSVSLSDHWLGIELPQWQDHCSHRSRLSQVKPDGKRSFLAYLLEENLPFIPPDREEPSHPDNLFKVLAADANILLLGEGGIGKTRTLYEVAERAVRQGWRVLHLATSENAIDLAAAASELLRHPGHTLALIDYIDQMAHFDAHFWRSTLLPEADRRQCRLHLLTNARPQGASESLKPLLDSGRFQTIEMVRSPGHRQQVADAIECRLCPTAIARIGREAVRQRCGPRPIIAMFVARELERLAQAEQLAQQDANIPHSSDLLGWIRRRLREAGLFASPALARSPWEAPEPPPPGLCAAVGALAASPLALLEIQAVAQATLRARQATAQHAPAIVAQLQEGGWVEATEQGEYRTPHDAIADQVLQEMLLPNPEMLPYILAASHLGRPLGRFARSLGRLGGILGDSGTSIEHSAQTWLRQHAQALGQSLCQNEPDSVAYALGAVFDYHPWSRLAVEHWDELVAPWLASNGTSIAARHLLHRGLKTLSAASGQHLLPAALDWLRMHGLRRQATFVLAPLLAWDKQRLGEQQPEILKLAMQWLAYEHNGVTAEAQFVFNPLLAWDKQRLGEQQPEILKLAMQWLAHEYNGVTAEDQFVFNPLLAWDKQRLGEQQPEVLKLAMQWLAHEHNGVTADAGFVLPPLLTNPALDRESRTRCSDLAVSWLRTYPERDDATHVLKHLLQAAGTYPDEVPFRESLICAGHWLDKNPEHSEKRFVIARLLRMKNLPQDMWQPLAKAGLDFLAQHGPNSQDDYLLNGIAARFMTLADSEQTRWAQLSARWIESSHRVYDIDSLFFSCRKFISKDHIRNFQSIFDSVRAEYFPDIPAFDWTSPFDNEYRASRMANVQSAEPGKLPGD